jgi:hypothetical protein
MKRPSWAPLMADLTWASHMAKLLRPSFSVTGRNPSESDADAAEG